MHRHLRAWIGRTGVSRAEAPGLLVATGGSVLALVVALRLPLTTWMSAGVGEPAAPGPVVVTPPPPTTSTTPPETLVHITGAVRSPGLVTLPADARVADAVAAAGGLAENAAQDAVNLARPVVDGEHVHAPTTDEVVGGAPASASHPSPTEGQLPDGRVDLNTADAARLERLPGVGPVLADRIVTHREQQGPFETAASVREVSGIGEMTWADLEQLVGVAGEPPPP